MKKQFSIPAVIVAVLLLIASTAVVMLVRPRPLAVVPLEPPMPSARAISPLTWTPPAPAQPAPVAVNPNLLPPPPPAARFGGELSYKESQSSASWSYGAAGSYGAFRDAKTGLIWGPRLKMTLEAMRAMDVKRAMDACAAMAPKGGWALPTAREFDTARDHGLLAIDGDAAHDWITYSDERRFVMPAVRKWAGEEKSFALRCVGRDTI